MKKIVIIILLAMFIVSCSSYAPKNVKVKYTKLSDKMDKLMDDVILERKRAELERDFIKFNKEMREYREKNIDEDTEYLNDYIKMTNIKIQYLRDLRD